MTKATKQLTCILADMINPLETARQERLETLSDMTSNPFIVGLIVTIMAFALISGLTMLVQKKKSSQPSREKRRRTLTITAVASLAVGITSVVGAQAVNLNNTAHDEDLFCLSTSSGTFQTDYAYHDGQWYEVLVRNLDIDGVAYPIEESDVPKEILDHPLTYRIGKWDQAKRSRYRILGSRDDYVREVYDANPPEEGHVYESGKYYAYLDQKWYELDRPNHAGVLVEWKSVPEEIRLRPEEHDTEPRSPYDPSDAQGKSDEQTPWEAEYSDYQLFDSQEDYQEAKADGRIREFDSTYVMMAKNDWLRYVKTGGKWYAIDTEKFDFETTPKYAYRIEEDEVPNEILENPNEHYAQDWNKVKQEYKLFESRDAYKEYQSEELD